MTLCDSHAHFGDYLDGIKYMLQDGSLCIILNTTDLTDFHTTLDFVRPFPKCVSFFAGVHPAKSQVETPEIANVILKNLPWISGIGEIGLDSRFDTADRLDSFRHQLELAERLRKPVSVHSRGMVGRVLEELSRYEPGSVLLHWFDSDERNLSVAASRGYYFSFGPAATYSKRLKRLVSLTPSDQLLVETDSPVVYGAFYGGKPADPRLVCSVLFSIAQERRIKVEELEDVVYENFKRFLGYDPLKDRTLD
ncbi:MAG: TatD family hydrolase [Nitrososphaerota archaeon]|nr:TatD family hydrolase [Nitrososphaerota archaeon]